MLTSRFDARVFSVVSSSVCSFCWFVCAALYATLGLADRRTRRLAPLVAAALAFAWSMPGLYPRLIAVGLSIVLCAKGFELVHGTVRDPRMLDSPPRFLVWLVIPPASHWPRDAHEARRHRLEGWHRLRRALPKIAICAGLLGVSARWPGVHAHGWWSIQWNLWMLYAALSGLADVVTGLAMQSGIGFAEVFDAPPLARSPRDFWSRRWNLYIHDLAYRHVFPRWGGIRHPLRATLGVFVVSGLMHEYVVWACLGHLPEHVGAMLAFFVIQGVAVAVELTWSRHRLRLQRTGGWAPRPLSPWIAVPLHQLWMTATAPLFFASLGEVFRSPLP